MRPVLVAILTLLLCVVQISLGDNVQYQEFFEVDNDNNNNYSGPNDNEAAIDPDYNADGDHHVVIDQYSDNSQLQDGQTYSVNYPGRPFNGRVNYVQQQDPAFATQQITYRQAAVAPETKVVPVKPKARKGGLFGLFGF